MDFLSKINANAGIDVKKDFVAENATVKNFEVSNSTNTSLSTTISPSVATFNNSNFNVSAINGIYIANDGTAVSNYNAEMTMCNGAIIMTTRGNGNIIKMESDSLNFCAGLIDIQYYLNNGINIIDSNNLTKLQFNTEFFTLHYKTFYENSMTSFGGPAFEITSIMANSYKNVQEALPTAEIKSQRLDISAYSKKR